MAQKAPGKHYRKGISLIEITRLFPDDATAETWFIETRWPDGATCPECDSKNVLTVKTRPASRSRTAAVTAASTSR